MLDNTKKQTLVEVRNLKKVFNAGRADEIIAIDNISFDIYEGEIFGLVGESGSGKSTTGRTLIKLEDMSSGKVRYKGENIEEIKGQRDLLAFRKSMQMIFQDPYASLNPRMTVNEIVGGPMDVHNLASSRHDRQERVNRLLERVGLNATYANRYPREFSGGQAQRVGIARALAVQPEFIIADEPISALDVSIQAQVVNLLMDLKKDYNLTYLFIAHDLSMVRFISDRIGVMKNGQILEISPANELYRAPVHPYTQSLLSAIPVADPTLDQQRKDYDESIQEYTEEEEDVRLHEIGLDHYVYCSAAEVPQYTAVYEQMMTSV